MGWGNSPRKDEMKFNGKVTNKTLNIWAKNLYEKRLEKLENKEVTVEIMEKKEKRSNPQNKYYWAILNFIQDETGNSREDLHSFFKSLYLSHQKNVLGVEFDAYISTTKLKTKEFSEYIEKIRLYMGEFGIYIPTSEEFSQIDWRK